MNINEALVHDANHPAFTDFNKRYPARYDLNPAMHDEHVHLDDLHRDDLPGPVDRDAIKKYTITSYDINHALRSPNPSEHWNNKANTLSNAINKAEPLEQDHHVYSSMSVHNPEAALNHSGGVFINKHFISGTIDPSIAVEHDNLKHVTDRFNDEFEHSDNTHIIHFHLPKGYTNGRYIARHSEYPGEHEFLLDRNQKWKLHDVHTIHDPKNPSRTRTIWTVKPHQSEVNELYKPWSQDKFTTAVANAKKHAIGYQMDHDDWSGGHTYKVPAEAAKHHDHLVRHFDEHIGSSEDHKSALRHYVEGGSSSINPILIKAVHAEDDDPFKYSTYKGHYERLKGVFHDAPALDHDVHAYSGLGFNPEKHFQEKNGVFHSPAFISSSVNPHIAVGIGAVHADRGGKVHILHFHLPKGYNKAMYAGSSTVNKYYTKQHELILDHNQKFKKVGELHTKVNVSDWRGKSSHDVIVHTVVPHDHHINEEVYHDGEEFFHDAFRKKVVNFAWHKAANSHPNPTALKKHHEELASAAVASARNLPPSLLDKKVPGVPHAHKHIAMFTRSSEAINHSLINGDNEHADWANGISEAIKTLHNPNAKELHVYSGTNHPHLISGKASVGDILHTPAFTSTSIDHTVAKGFGWNHVDPAKPSEANHHIIHFELPEGYSRGAYIQPHSWLPHEKEYLLDKDQKWKIKDKQDYRTRDDSLDEIKRTVWTVVPHDHDIHEALEHNPNLLSRSGENYTDSSGPWLKKPSTKDYSHKSWKRASAQREAAHKVGIEHGDHLSTYHSFTPAPDEADLLNRYTRTLSARITHTLLTTPEAHEKSLEGHNQSHIQSLNEIRADNLAEADRVSHVIGKHAVPLREPAHVYSGLGYDPRSHFETNDGVIHIPAFTSTSLDARTPHGFTVAHTDPAAHKVSVKDIKPKPKPERISKPSDDIFGWEPDHSGSLSSQEASHWTKHHFVESANDRHILHFELPVGYKKGLYIAPHSRYAEENEYLLDKGQKWKLKKHEVKSSLEVHRTAGDKFTAASDDLASHELKTHKTKTRTHIWTVVPHDSHK